MMNKLVEYYKQNYIKLKNDIHEIKKNYKKEIEELDKKYQMEEKMYLMRYEKYKQGDKNALTNSEKFWHIFFPKFLHYLLILLGIGIFLISMVFGLIYYLLIGILLLFIFF